MAVVRRTKSGPLRRWMAAALGLASLALAGGIALTQGCARCGAPQPIAFEPGAAPKAAVALRREGWKPKWKLKMSLRREKAGYFPGNYRVCVRACDGAFFPVAYSGAGRSDSLEDVCRSLCPNGDVALYSFPFGGTIDEAVSATGQAYVDLPNAGKFQQTFDPNCSCRASGQTWAEALAGAEAKYGRHSRDIVISAEAAERMSRPAQDPKAMTSAADPDPSLAPAPAGPPAALDVNGVDTPLKAAAAALSRESSGIREDDGPRVAHYGLGVGRMLEEKAPDGSIRQVRLLPSTF